VPLLDGGVDEETPALDAGGVGATVVETGTIVVDAAGPPVVLTMLTVGATVVVTVVLLGAVTTGAPDPPPPPVPPPVLPLLLPLPLDEVVGALLKSPMTGSAGMLNVRLHEVELVSGIDAQSPVVALYLYGATLEPHGMPIVTV
jgi:hypothetical protein